MMNPAFFNVKALGIGFASGLGAALLGLLLLKFLPEGNLDDLLSNMMKSLNPQWYHILFLFLLCRRGRRNFV
ncbi:MAG: hypothetical protein LRY27_02835 [Chitinophagales bacterium]|nr:hypothetical protein [Chitinophagales bacterium]